RGKRSGDGTRSPKPEDRRLRLAQEFGACGARLDDAWWSTAKLKVPAPRPFSPPPFLHRDGPSRDARFCANKSIPVSVPAAAVDALRREVTLVDVRRDRSA